MNTQPETTTLSQEEIDFLTIALKEGGYKSLEDFENHIKILREDMYCENEQCNSDKNYAQLLDSIAKFLILTKEDYEKDRTSCCPAPEEIDFSVDRVLLILLKGLLLTGYAPDDSVIELMKEYIKRHE